MKGQQREEWQLMVLMGVLRLSAHENPASKQESQSVVCVCVCASLKC